MADNSVSCTDSLNLEKLVVNSMNKSWTCPNIPEHPRGFGSEFEGVITPIPLVIEKLEVPKDSELARVIYLRNGFSQNEIWKKARKLKKQSVLKTVGSVYSQCASDINQSRINNFHQDFTILDFQAPNELVEKIHDIRIAKYLFSISASKYFANVVSPMGFYNSEAVPKLIYRNDNPVAWYIGTTAMLHKYQDFCIFKPEIKEIIMQLPILRSKTKYFIVFGSIILNEMFHVVEMNIYERF